MKAFGINMKMVAIAWLLVLSFGTPATLRADPPRFARSAAVANQPVVTDARTGLVWQGCSQGMTASLSACTGSDSDYTWPQAIDTCEDLQWAGYTDWKLPDVKEISSIVDDRKTSPAIDASSFPGTNIMWFWSSTSDRNGTHAFGLYFFSGVVGIQPKTEYMSVRCVRRGP